MSEDQSNKFYERFGRYLILDHLVDGGMAKICRARFLGEQANKIVAIKMTQPQFSKDPAFVQMFEDELKVSFGLQHPNIAQVYDYGSYEGQLFTAMEYVHGRNLKEYLDRLREKKFVFPVEISVYIISQVCQALHYAHTFKDKLTGKSFNIIHRDISPHNIMLTYDGAVKVIDFGIAKADSNSEATQAGTIKGKLSYLAPEYLEGYELDHRYDQFAVGITIWEMLCSRKLFQASNDLAVLKKIQECKVPAPSSINPNVPKELDEIVLKSLSKDRSQRYENMDKFNRALIKFLYSKYPDFNATDLAYFANQLYKEDIEQDLKKFVEYGKINIAEYIEQWKKDGKSEGSGESGTQIKGPRRNILDLKIEDNTGVDLSLDAKELRGAMKGQTSSTSGTKTRKGSLEALKNKSQQESTGTKIIVKGFAKKDNSGDDLPPELPSEAKKVKAQKTRMLKKRAKKKSPAQEEKTDWMRIAVVIVAGLAVVYIKSDTIYRMTGISFFGPSEQSRSVASEEEKTGKLFLEGLNPYMEIYINNKKIENAHLGYELPLNKRMKLEARRKGYLPFVKDFVLKQDNSKIVIPALKAGSAGELSTAPHFKENTKLKIRVGDEVKVFSLPLKNYRLPAGSYRGVVVDPVLETEREVSFTIEENKNFILE